MSGRPFEVVQPTVEHRPMPPPTVSPDNKTMQDAAHALRIALTALSQRALVAISALFTLGTVGLTWWLWATVLPDPKPLQLAGLGGWAFFVVVIEWVRRRP
jgi:hypothetical protein